MDVRYLAALGLATVSMSGCASGIGLRASDASALRLSRYHTFFVLDAASSGSTTTDARIRADLEGALDARGWVDVPRDEAQAVVVPHVATSGQQSYEAFYRGWGGWPWKDCAGASGATAASYTPGTLVVDIFDAESKDVLWSAVAPNAATASPDKSGGVTERAITRMFEAFPTMEPTGEEAEPVTRTDVSISSDVPRIIFEQAPAVLIQIDGMPEYKAIDGTGLTRVVNARPFIVRDDDGIHYMKVGDGWMQAYTLTGMWSLTGTVPAGAAAALARALEGRSTPIDLLEKTSLPAAPNQEGPAPAPAVHVSTTPAALIVTDGPPQFAPKEGTRLRYLQNTTARVLEEPTDQELYVHVSGEWYRAWTESGPWQHVAAADLPEDITVK